MRFDILTLFPGMFESLLQESMIGRAIRNGLIEVACTDRREYTRDKYRKTDDYPYGGGNGMVMMAQPIYDAWAAVKARAGEGAGEGAARPLTVYMSPQGTPLSQQKVESLAAEHPHLILLCGHYEGVDERVLEEIVDEEISIGDYVLTGGELPAMVLVDAVSRLVPGVLANGGSVADESHSTGLLEYPQFTRPEEFMGRRVPEILLSGHHARIAQWRREAALERTQQRRPDMYARYMDRERRR
ncbi:MAG TPA: tRNA (guanosine(37)-N1)-methyltransferase TrmD [Clostridiales bacterium]|nr:tRNA (guanosine(37)-N1)-methyltransferase TrmD [Clostridiales bacterium]